MKQNTGHLLENIRDNLSGFNLFDQINEYSLNQRVCLCFIILTPHLELTLIFEGTPIEYICYLYIYPSINQPIQLPL